MDMPSANIAKNDDENVISSWMDSFTLDDFDLKPIISAVAVAVSPNQSSLAGE